MDAAQAGSFCKTLLYERQSWLKGCKEGDVLPETLNRAEETMKEKAKDMSERDLITFEEAAGLKEDSGDWYFELWTKVKKEITTKGAVTFDASRIQSGVAGSAADGSTVAAASGGQESTKGTSNSSPSGLRKRK